MPRLAFLYLLLSTMTTALVTAQLNGPYYADFTVGGSGYFCWTEWLDRDDPSGTGDHETLVDMPPTKVCEKPVGIQCQTITHTRSDLTGEVFVTPCEPRIGLQCYNDDQADDDNCLDYRVRFLCPAGTIQDQASIGYCKAYCWTNWLDRDNPSGTGDWETIMHFAPSLTCWDPVGVHCRQKDTEVDWKDAGQVYQCNTHTGGLCLNNQQSPGLLSKGVAIPGVVCKEYEVRFLCNCGICV